MALKLDNNLLEELGLGALPADEKSKMLAQIYQTLEERVGMKLAERMTDEQLNEFERFVNGDVAYARSFLDAARPGWEAGEAYQAALQNARADAERRGAAVNDGAVIAEFAALNWLETTFPNYKQVVADEFEALKAEIRQVAPQIVAASQQPPAAA